MLLLGATTRVVPVTLAILTVILRRSLASSSKFLETGISNLEFRSLFLFELGNLTHECTTDHDKCC